MALPNASNAISLMLFLHLKEIYQTAISELKSRTPFRRIGINGFHANALSTYALAVAAWEAFLNETCMSGFAEIQYPNSPLWDIRDKAEWWKIEEKSVLIPKPLLGTTFDKSTQPYQDFLRLVKVRNHIVHFRLEVAPLKTLEQLSQRRISLIPPEGAQYSWPLQLQSTECVRLVINNVSQMVSVLTSWFPYGSWPGDPMAFTMISEEEAKSLFQAAGIEPTGKPPA